MELTAISLLTGIYLYSLMFFLISSLLSLQWGFTIWLGRKDYKSRPVICPSSHQQKTLMFKIVPDDFVEPVTVRSCHLNIFASLLSMQCGLLVWLGRQDSNLRMPGSKPGALPLGDGPIFFYSTLQPGFLKRMQRRLI